MMRSESIPACHLGSLVFREAGYTSDFRMPAHIHEEDRLVLVLQGTVQHTCRREAHLLMMEALSLELLTAIGRSEREVQDATPPHWLRQAHDFLHAHFTEPLSIEAIATVAEVHPFGQASLPLLAGHFFWRKA